LKKDVNIFEKDFLIIPINKAAHWYLAIICYPILDEPIYKGQIKNKSESTKILNENINELSDDELSTNNNSIKKTVVDTRPCSKR
jgi:sentrin-specific protease 7